MAVALAVRSIYGIASGRTTRIEPPEISSRRARERRQSRRRARPAPRRPTEREMATAWAIMVRSCRGLYVQAPEGTALGPPPRPRASMPILSMRALLLAIQARAPSDSGEPAASPCIFSIRAAAGSGSAPGVPVQAVYPVLLRAGHPCHPREGRVPAPAAPVGLLDLFELGLHGARDAHAAPPGGSRTSRAPCRACGTIRAPRPRSSYPLWRIPRGGPARPPFKLSPARRRADCFRRSRAMTVR